VSTRERIAAASVLALAFAVRALLVVSLNGQPFFAVPIADAAGFDQWARHLAEGGVHAFVQDPLYAYGLGIFYTLFGHHVLWAGIVQALLGTAGLGMLFEGTRRLVGFRTALAALGIGAVSKLLLFYDAMLLPDFLGVVAVEAAILAVSLEKPWKWLLFGAVLGLGSLARGSLILLPLAVAGFLAVRREWKPAALALAGWGAVLAPVTLRNIAVEKEFVLATSHVGVNLWIGNNPDNLTGRYRLPPFAQGAAPGFEGPGFALEAERRAGRPLKPSEADRYWRGEALGFIGHHPGTFVGVTMKRALLVLWGHEVPDDLDPSFLGRFSWVLRLPLFTVGVFTLPLALAGLYLSWPERARFGPLYVLLGAAAASTLPFAFSGRCRLPFLPILVFFAAHALVKGAQLIHWRMSALPRTAGAIFGIALLLVNLPLPEAVAGPRDFRAAHRKLGAYYRELDQPGPAAREYEAALALDPDLQKDESFILALAECYEAAGDRPRALDAYRRLSALATSSPEVSYRIGLVYFREGMFDQAADQLEKAVARRPSFGAAYEPLAEAYRKARRPDAAKDALDRGVAALPQDWSLRLRRAELFRDLSMWKEAVAAAEEVLRLRPGQPDAIRLRDDAARKSR
jgi:hypothetical protein